eukprot:TRINITY_DN9018_c0_g2_i1.p1 TRINITY_DN9018_c0_g2~~TRINITY_DN9018_c0_g2_i1.p1  ORF type:complete len:558 (+),score=94.78 TRINITY_DN9018_c0_g2_i1:79-1752(+)
MVTCSRRSLAGAFAHACRWRQAAPAIWAAPAPSLSSCSLTPHRGRGDPSEAAMLYRRSSGHRRFSSGGSSSSTSPPARSQADETGTPSAFAASPDGSILFWAGSAGELHAVTTATGALRWTAPFPQDSGSPPVQISLTPDGSTIVFRSSGAFIHAAAAASGELRWSLRLCKDDYSVATSCVVTPDGATVLAGTTDGDLHAVSLASGAVKWTYKVGDALPEDWSFALTPDGSTVLFWAADGRMHAVSAASGDTRWKTTDAAPMPSTWSISTRPDGSLAYFVGAEGVLYAVDVPSGGVKWQHSQGLEEDKPEKYSLSPDGSVVFLVTRRHIRAIAATVGDLQWSCDVGGAGVSSLVFAPDGATLFAALEPPASTGKGGLRALDAQTGEQKWIHEKDSLVADSLVVAEHGRSLCFWTGSGVLHAVAAQTGEVCWMREFKEVTAPSLLIPPDGLSLCFAKDGEVHTLLAASGEDRWLSAEAMRSNSSVRLSGSSLIRTKRLAVLAALGGMWLLHRSGWLTRKKGNSASDEDVLETAVGEQLATYLRDVMSEKGEAKRQASS